MNESKPWTPYQDQIIPIEPLTPWPWPQTATTGMDLRDWFAGMALQGAVVDGYYDCPELAADYAYKIADAMMEQRKSPAETGKE
jgi:hypothetical protein